MSNKDLINRSKSFSLKYAVKGTYLYDMYIKKQAQGVKEKDINLDTLEKECIEKLIKGELWRQIKIRKN